MSMVSRTVRKLGPIGGYALAKKLCRYQPRILMYHRFSDIPVKGRTSVMYFEKQVAFIRKHYQPFSLCGLIQHINEYQMIPENAVVITIDDGYRDFYDYAFPILSKYQVPATLYVTTGFVDHRLWLWPDKLTWLLENVHKAFEDVTFGGVSFREGQVLKNANDEYWRPLIDYALSIPDTEKLQFISELAQKLGQILPVNAPEEFAPVSWDQLRELECAGIEVGGHTVTHPTLGQVTEKQASDEIFGCRNDLVSNLGDKPRTFCYPNGQPKDIQKFLLPMVERAGFLGAVTAFPDGKGISERFAMRRHASGDNMFQFNKAVSGVEYLGHRMRGNIQNI